MRPRTGHDVCPQQRVVDFHKALLQGFNILTPFMVSGASAMDFFLMEPAACICSLATLVANILVKRVEAQTKARGDVDTPRVHLATSLQPLAEEARSSMSFRQHLAAARGLLQPLAETYGTRQLKRA